jgi:methyl-accepting chemotaxis protein
MEKKSINISQKPNRKQFTLRFTLTSAFCGLTLLGGLFLSTVTAMKVGEFIREELRIRLADVISIMASQVNGDLHHKVQTATDEKSESYLKLQSQIREMRDRGTHIAYAYTMRHLPNGQAAFIVDATEDGKDFSHVGDVYKDTTVTLAEALDASPDVTTPFVEPDLHVDDWGTFLSAYAPIYTSDGKKDGIIGVDVSAASQVQGSAVVD